MDRLLAEVTEDVVSDLDPDSPLLNDLCRSWIGDEEVHLYAADEVQAIRLFRNLRGVEDPQSQPFTRKKWGISQVEKPGGDRVACGPMMDSEVWPVAYGINFPHAVARVVGILTLRGAFPSCNDQVESLPA